MTILDEILDDKRREVAASQERVPAEELAARAADCVDPPRGFRRALAEAAAPAIIAEIKRRSPSRGEIRPDMDPVACARAYASGGAACLSVLTDETYFGGRLSDLAKVRRVVSIPLLRKDFIIDPYQVDEARVAGADAILLIVSALTPEELSSLSKRARRHGLDVLVEVHDEPELETALACGADLIGVNNRDLRTFETNLGVTERLAPRLPDRSSGDDVLLVAESGIHTPGDVERLTRCGARAFLVGESLMRQPDVGHALRQLRRSE
jgi:indole-3-glycerol phosphate synthase